VLDETTGGTNVSREVVGAAVVAGVGAHGDELVVDAGLLQAHQRARATNGDTAQPYTFTGLGAAIAVAAI